MKLGVNVDHVATVRQAREASGPDPVNAAFLAELAGADGVTVHLRQDRRHINERDLKILRKVIKIRLNLEMAELSEMAAIALEIKPDTITLVPERREELTTEGGLNIVKRYETLKKFSLKLKQGGIETGAFIDTDIEQIQAAAEMELSHVEFNTGKYSEAKGRKNIRERLKSIEDSVKLAKEKGLRVNAGHGLDYKNVADIASIEEIGELNIGHSIVSRAIYVGMFKAVKEMIDAIANARRKGS